MAAGEPVALVWQMRSPDRDRTVTVGALPCHGAATVDTKDGVEPVILARFYAKDTDADRLLMLATRRYMHRGWTMTVPPTEVELPKLPRGVEGPDLDGWAEWTLFPELMKRGWV